MLVYSDNYILETQNKFLLSYEVASWSTVMRHGSMVCLLVVISLASVADLVDQSKTNFLSPSVCSVSPDKPPM